MGHFQDPDPFTPHNFDVRIDRTDGDVVHATVHVLKTIPPGGIELAVVYNRASAAVVSVTPWRNLGRFVLEELAHKTGASSSH